MAYMLKKHWCLVPGPEILIKWPRVLNELGGGLSKCSSGYYNEHGNLCSMPSFSCGNEHSTQNMTAQTLLYSFRTELMTSEWAFILSLQFQPYCLTLLRVLDCWGLARFNWIAFHCMHLSRGFCTFLLLYHTCVFLWSSVQGLLKPL